MAPGHVGNGDASIKQSKVNGAKICCMNLCIKVKCFEVCWGPAHAQHIRLFRAGHPNATKKVGQPVAVRLIQQKAERERERFHYIHLASLAYEDGSVFMSGPFAEWL